ncbi:hypothetical protein CO033_02300 [Candidatus Nomurabacteria bacterium CG_4_9_14_0_2_um_filter_32_10]|uniref:DUF378 domain-containing protein n=3 Tax=Candidatus Nomuraibacteriota TaxID=1752729 RepID=A0A2H0CG96_9BACT|nr:MAG: hypothetical protein COW91_03035 [Candidatus Nomurabacteria bacterium CG22_combo_CG10-13_8_21_14_all_32_8]PIZ86011.1 MAG: hypothetical protein COX94_01350 [Candidatus Nomurabacteria bacterium CG_4_10_14_0_2_um_filter_33_9]PJC49295.1 MAG: hypothetical protein CO033_02300 [Candidatus Nomurabacteria bacterium CG_4_9_14_0_2_um_filter_32_10]
MCKGCCSKGSCALTWITKILVIIGGINWGLIGLGMFLGSVEGWNVVNMVLGFSPVLEGIVYVLVGVAAIMFIFECKCSKCEVNASVDTSVNTGGNM